ncbi:MAG: ABC transporter ATP-binding protein [Blastocatellia bacterium]|nr:ABC transporter ATP-binding protein [Chloracidobacterium sp.]MBL8183952.1 ABC transporter ATP-binding protein [Blastocatellia bacterium]HBE81700.1 ABC transporter permease [Blastocatellia bacterium]
MLISRLAGMVLPASTKFIGDEVFVNQRYDLIKWIALAIGVSTLVQGTTSFALSQILGVAAQRAITEMRKRVQSHIERLPISFFDSTQSGQLISRIMNDAEGIRNLVGTGLGQILGSLVTAVIAIGVLFYLNWQLTAATIVVLLIFGGALLYAFKVLRPIFRERGEITAEVTGRLGESLGGIRVVKAYTAEKREDLSFARGAHRLFRNIAKTVTGVSAIGSFSSIVIGAVAVIMIVIGGNAVQAGTMTLGDFLMYISFTFLLAIPVFELTSVGTQITEALAGLDRIREVMAMTTEDEEDSKLRPITNADGTIEFENVEFEYEKGVPVLKGVSFRSNAGTTTALVGSSGSGKSTILSLVLNFIKPTAGVVKIDGQDLQTVKLRDYRRHLGVVLQDNFLFDGSILENIRFANPTATLESIRAVCKVANADEFIEKFPNGYDTIVGERGVKLSGGQRQRIAIARALLADPRILILDEATSSLDSESEALIQEGLNNLRKGRTTFVIAHRLSTIRSADQILVVEAGEILERGTHDELIKIDGRYKQLYDKQYRFEQNLFVNPGEDFTTKPPVTLAQTKL